MATCRAGAATGRTGLPRGLPHARFPGAITSRYQGIRWEFTQLGWRVGENVVIEYRFGDNEMERLPTLAADLVRLGVDIILTTFNPITAAAMKATTTIPIVMINSIDPVGAGLSPVWRAPAETSPGSPEIREARFLGNDLS